MGQCIQCLGQVIGWEIPHQYVRPVGRTPVDPHRSGGHHPPIGMLPGEKHRRSLEHFGSGTPDGLEHREGEQTVGVVALYPPARDRVGIDAVVTGDRCWKRRACLRRGHIASSSRHRCRGHIVRCVIEVDQGRHPIDLSVTVQHFGHERHRGQVVDGQANPRRIVLEHDVNGCRSPKVDGRC